VKSVTGDDYGAAWYFDALVWPGWLDYLSLVLAVVGFIIAICQLSQTRTSLEAATEALSIAQDTLSQKALAAVQAQIQTVAADLTFSVMYNNEEVAHRALVRYGLLAREAAEILDNLDPVGNKSLIQKLKATSTRATAAKTAVMAVGSAGSSTTVADAAEMVSNEIENVHQNLMSIASR
jgi:hypothetical protein